MGLLAYMAGGALKGVGDAMVNKAKQEREDTLLALAEANKRTDAATEQNYRTANIDQQGNIQSGLEDKRIGGEKEIAGINNTAADKRTDKTIASEEKRTGMTEAGANTRNAASIASEEKRNAATIQGGKDVANIRAQAIDYRADQLAARVAGDKPLNYNQALLAARQAYAQNYKSGIPMTDDNGDPIPAEKWAADQADKLMAKQAATRGNGGTFINQNPSVTGGGLLNPSATAMPSLPVTPISPLTSAPSLSTPAGTSPGGDDGWIVKRISP